MLEQLVPLISLCFEAHVGQRVARAILTTYLGEESGERVLAGHIQRGDVESIQAAIWFSDLRGFTQLSQTAPPEELVSWLNRYFGIVFPAIRAAGGEVLKLMGDGVLGMFRVGIERSERAACEAALTVALRVEQRLRETAEDDAQPGLPTLRQGVALHVGDLQYGNIGDDLRLDFTVIGTAVNLASRIEGLCSRLARPILVSQAFADCLPHAWESHGPFELKGLTDKQRVYSPALVAAGHRL
jgi:adenylate cyclase